MNVLTVVALFLLWTAPGEADDPPPKGGLNWRTLEAGVAEAAEQRTPIVLVDPGREPTRYWSTLEEKIFRSKTALRQLEQFVLIEVTSEDRAEVRRILGDLGGKSSLALLNFRGSVLHRWDEDAPARPRLSLGLKRAWRQNAIVRKHFVRAEKEIEKARYALRIGEQRKSVLFLLEARKVPLPPGSSPIQEIRTLSAEIEKIYAKRVVKAEALEDKGDYASAIAEYERLIHDFPLPEKQKEWRSRVTELWRKIYQPTY